MGPAFFCFFRNRRAAGVPPYLAFGLTFFRNPGECLETRPILCYNSGEEQQV